MKLLSFVAASVLAVNAMAANVDSQSEVLKSISLNEMKEVQGNSVKDFQNMAQNTLYTAGNFVMQLGADIVFDAGFQTVQQITNLLSCPAAQMDEEFGYDLKYEPLKYLQKVVNGRENGRTSAITGIVFAHTGCAINVAAETLGVLAINTGDRLVDLVAIPGQLGHDIRVISYTRAGKYAKLVVRTTKSNGEPLDDLQLDVRVVALAAGMPDTALMAAGALAEGAYIGLQHVNQGWKVAVNGAVTGIDMGVRTAAFVVDIPVVRAVALSENAVKAVAHTAQAAWYLGKVVIFANGDDADAYGSHRTMAAKQVFYSIGSVVSGRSASKIDKLMNE